MAVKASASVTLSAVRDLASCTRYYLLQSSTLSPPSRPSDNPPGGSWVTAEPSYTTGSTNSLYFCDLNVFSDGDYAYSDVSLSSSYEAAKAAYNAAQTARATAEQALSNTEVVVGTQTGNTSRWTGRASFAQLLDGQQIVYWLPCAYSSRDYVPYQPAGGSSANGTGLNLTLADDTETGFVPCFYGGETRITSQYGAGSAIRLLYRTNVVLNGHTYAAGWWADANYDSNTYDRVRFNNSVKAKTAISASRVIVGDSAGYFHLAAGSVFDVDKPILWAGSGISANATGSNNFLSIPGCTLRNNAGSGWTATQYATLYLAGTLNGRTFTVAAQDWLTTAPADASLTYVSLGYMYSTYQMYLYPEHPMYRIVDGALKAVSQIACEAMVAAESAQDAVEALDNDLTQQEIFNRLTDNGAAQGLVLYNGQLYVNASYIKAGQINVGLIDFTNYEDYEFLVPNENDSTTLFTGQSIVNGWIVESGGLTASVTVLKCNDARPLRGKKVTLSVETRDGVGGGDTFCETETGGSAQTWTAPTYGAVDGKGNLIGPTGQGDFYRFGYVYTVPEDAIYFSIAFDCGGARAIQASTDTTSDFSFMYGNNVSISYKGLQVGKFVVDKTGNVTSGGRNRFDGAVSVNGGISFGHAASSFEEGVRFYRDSSVWDSMTANGGDFYFGAGKTNQALNQANADARIFAGNVTLSKLTDASGTADNIPALIIGSQTGQHLEFDTNEIMAKASDTTVGTLNLNIDGGNVAIGKANNANYNTAINSTKASTSKETGALVVNGGLGVAGSLYANYVEATSSLAIKPDSTDNANSAMSINGGKTNQGTHSDTNNTYTGYPGEWARIYFQNRYRKVKNSDSSTTWYPSNIYFRLYSATADSGDHLNHYETYLLPGCEDNLTEKKQYDILTTKTVTSGTKNAAFSSGKATFSFSDFGVSSRPSTIILTPQNDTARMLVYDWSNSSGNIVIKAYKADGTAVSNGNYRFCYICMP